MSTKSWRNIYAVHPVADVFPLMSKDELRQLAKDIKANGLQNPVLIWRSLTSSGEQKFVLDGRNRLDAMELAGMPILEGGELHSSLWRDVLSMSSTKPAAFAIALNIKRRHLAAEDRARLAKAALKAEQEFAKSASSPTAGQSTVGERADKGQQKKGGASLNTSVVARVAKAAGVHRDTARKVVKEDHVLAEEEHQEKENAKTAKYAAIHALISQGMPTLAIKKQLKVGTKTITDARRLLNTDATPQPKKSPTPVLVHIPKVAVGNGKKDKWARGTIDEIEETKPDELSNPQEFGEALISQGRRFIKAAKRQGAAS